MSAFGLHLAISMENVKSTELRKQSMCGCTETIVLNPTRLKSSSICALKLITFDIC